MTVYFANSGLIDLDVIRVMGVSVKTRDNPIGYFGTGLKFALAPDLARALIQTTERLERVEMAAEAMAFEYETLLKEPIVRSEFNLEDDYDALTAFRKAMEDDQ